MSSTSNNIHQERDPQKRANKILKSVQSDRDKQLRSLKKAAKTHRSCSNIKNCSCSVILQPSTFVGPPSRKGSLVKIKETAKTKKPAKAKEKTKKKEPAKKTIKCGKKNFFSKPFCLKRALKERRAKKSKSLNACRRRVRRRRETRNMCCRCAICGAAIGIIAAFSLYWIPIYMAVVGAL